MNLFFEESGNFKVGKILSQQGEAYQVEIPSGKRSKVKTKNIVLKFNVPTPIKLMEDAQAIAKTIDINFLWEVVGEQEFIFTDLSNAYFGHQPSPQEIAGLLLCLHSTPMYFYKISKGCYKATSQKTLSAALLGLKKKQQQELIQTQYIKELKTGNLPKTFESKIMQLLFQPEKNSIEYKAINIVCKELQITPPQLMLNIGGLHSSKDLHYSKFLFHYFPKGSKFPKIKIPKIPTNLPKANVQAFSIDDITTTEIDDALSVTKLINGTIRIGIHIAAPSLVIQRDDKLDIIARQRMSTVYMPDDKITMLPNEIIEVFTLNQGKYCPALSLYAILNSKDLSLITTESRVEMVLISANLRHNDLDTLVTEEMLTANKGNYPHKNDISLLWKWAQILEQNRMIKRASFGLRQEQINRVDFNFYVNNDKITITPRKRRAPLDKIVTELMIFTNSTWGKLMHDYGVPGIYRTQNNNCTAKMQVHSTIAPITPHESLGVNQYAWSTSPLRRYIDLVNQWQILACLKHGITAPLVAPFKILDTTKLCTIMTTFNTTYSNYNTFQSNIERYWCLRWLAQENIKQVDAIVLKDEILRLIDIPLIVRLHNMPTTIRGEQVKLDLLHIDEINLTIKVRLVEEI